MAIAPDGLRAAIEGVSDCKRHCAAACPTCKFASFSWAKFACICYERCDVRLLALHQLIDETHPELLKPPGSIWWPL